MNVHGDIGPSPRRMQFQFSLYGFLKNQRYFEPFLQLFLLQAVGRDWFKWSLLLSLHMALIILLEVPSGAVADLYGRRRCMIFSFLAYIVSFTLFAFASTPWQLLAPIALLALGDAFRTGTHKAMIFDYLQRHSRTAEKTAYYGATRSWSKMGSVLMVLISCGLIFLAAARRASSDIAVYRWLFLACIPPYLLQILNFCLYPKHLDGSHGGGVRLRQVFTHLLRVGRDSIRVSALRGLLAESMCYEGMYKVARKYLQAIVEAAALALPLLAALRFKLHRVAGLMLAVYLAMYLLESMSSRRSDVVRRKMGGEEPAARLLWKLNLIVFAIMAAGLAMGWCLQGATSQLGVVVVIAGFLALAVLQNLWRPLQLGRFGAAGDSDAGATILSVESQARNLVVVVAAPVVGLAVNALQGWGRIGHDSPIRFLPVALAGMLFASAALLFRRRLKPTPSAEDTSNAGGKGV